MSPDDSTPPQAKSWKFGLRTLLLVVAFLCLSFPLILQSRRLEKAETELRRLRDETGRLTIEDRTKVHVMLVGGSTDPMSWKWRLFIPKGARYGWSLAYGEITNKQLPKAKMNSFFNDPYDEKDNEVFVTASLNKRGDGDYDLSVGSRIGDSTAQMGGVSVKVPGAVVKQTFGCLIGNALGAKSTALLDPGKPVVLLLNRACGKDPDGNEGFIEYPTPGYMIWMTPTP